MTIRKRDAKLLLILLGAVFLAIAYFAVYSPYLAKAQQLEAETQALTPQLTQLRGYYQNLGTYRNGTGKAQSTIASEKKRYPTDVRPEDMLMYAEQLRQNFGLDIQKVSFADPVSVLQFKDVVPKGSSYTLRDLTAYRRSMTITGNLSYQGMKDMIDYVNGTALRTTVDSITVSFDSETGQLTGNATLDQYFLTGAGDPYVATPVPDVGLGKSNLFGTVSAPPTQSK